MFDFEIRNRLTTNAAKRWFGLVAIIGLVNCGTLQDWKDENKGIQISSLTPPLGHSVSVWATDLPQARHMAMGDLGTLFVGSMVGKVYALRIAGGEVKQQHTVLQGLTDPSGVAFRDETLYVADRTRILRYRNIETKLDNPGEPEIVVDGLPDKARHDAHAMGAYFAPT